MKVLLFKNPVFHSVINYTVRHGGAWAERTEPDDYLDIRDADDHSGRIGLVAWVKVVIRCRIVNIPRDVYNQEHDPKCRSRGGLLRILREVYGDLKEMRTADLLNETVTCIGFVVLEK